MLNVQSLTQRTFAQIVVFALLLLNSTLAFAQNQVNGIVTDKTGEPLIGVNVVEKGTTNGVITDFNGQFTLNVAQGKTLVFSYVGYTTQEITVKGSSLKIIMEEDSKTLDEVVVVGYGSMSRKDVTSSITTVKADKLNVGVYSDPGQLLQGKVPGLTVVQSSDPTSGTASISLRGASSLRTGAAMEPYYVIDGIPGMSLSLIAPEDIESIDVLRDASATAIYGSRGANGVVLITTKHGGAGKINIDAKVETSYNTRTITPEFADGYSYAMLMNEARITRNQEPIYSPGELEILRRGLDPDLYPNVDWMGMLLRDGAMQYRANLNLNGGGSTARYFVSVSYLQENGMYNTDESLRKDYNTNTNAGTWNYRLNTDIDITNTTLLKVGVSGSLRKWNEPGLSGDIWKSLMYQNPISIPVMYSNGYVPAYGTGEQTNPWVLATQTGYKEHWENTVQTNITLEQKLDFITKGLRFVGRFGFDTWNKTNIDRIKWPKQWKAQRQRDEYGNLVFTQVTDEQLMTQSSSSEGNRKEVFEAELHYDRAFNEHHIGGLAKFNYDTQVATVNIGDDIKNGIARRHMGLAGRFSYLSSPTSANHVRIVDVNSRTDIES